MISPDTTAKGALETLQKSRLHSLLVGNDGLYVGLVRRGRVEEAVNGGASETLIHDLLVMNVAHAHPDHPLEVVLERLGKIPGVLPVVSRKQVREVLGIITAQTVMQFLQKTWDEPAAERSHTSAK